MDDMEEYTINDDLRACGMPDNDDDNLVAGAEALFGSSIAPIIVDAGAGDGGVCDAYWYVDADRLYWQHGLVEARQVCCLERL
ncbi:hypothetical protein C2845_PM10G13520 [Panicum miliaceum]|uniref:Uncharacterized protein n=1 Tax=Panicum miliaceum TaxID=4540 RepID=A0A3L6PIM1_PANMI|nr:hypothetical protein C2845_PM10G13520 [Panicum miliaceum]